MIMTLDISSKPGWLENYQSGFVRSKMPSESVQVLENLIGERKRKKYIDGDHLIIEVNYETKYEALKDMVKLAKIESDLENEGFKCRISIE